MYVTDNTGGLLNTPFLAKLNNTDLNITLLTPLLSHSNTYEDVSTSILITANAIYIGGMVHSAIVPYTTAPTGVVNTADAYVAKFSTAGVLQAAVKIGSYLLHQIINLGSFWRRR